MKYLVVLTTDGSSPVHGALPAGVHPFVVEASGYEEAVRELNVADDCIRLEVTQLPEHCRVATI